jgi:hypothetical protein
MWIGGLVDIDLAALTPGRFKLSGGSETIEPANRSAQPAT